MGNRTIISIEYAKAFIKQGEINKARRVLAYLLRKDRDDVEAWVLLSECALNQYEYDRCKREVLLREPNHPAFQFKQAIADKEDPVAETLSSLGLMTQQMPAITTMEIQTILPPSPRRQPVAFLSPFRRRLLRGMFFVGLAAAFLIGIVLLGVFFNSLASENDANTVATQNAYNAAAATIYVENTFTAATVQVRATQFTATEQAVMPTQPAVLMDSRLLYRRPDGTEDREQFAPSEAVSIQFEPTASTSRDAVVRVEILNEAGLLVAHQEQTLGSLRLLTVEPPQATWQLGSYTLRLLVDGVIGVELTFVVTD